MKLVELSIKGNVQEILTNDTLEVLMDLYIPSSDIKEYYTDTCAYIADHVMLSVIEEEVTQKLWLLTTGVSGWDTYDSGVFSAMTSQEAKEIARRLSNDFEYPNAELIGTSYLKKSGEVCTSFNAG